MPTVRHYSPRLSRFIVSVLYHHAKAQGVPMTKLTDTLLRESLVDTDAWRTAETMIGRERSIPVPTRRIQAA